MKDPLGQALIDFQISGKKTDVIIKSDSFDDDVIPTQYFFRSYNEMPKTEQKAMQLAKGKILDVGAGAGCHSIYLQNKDLEVTAVDISPLACKCMEQRGVKNVILSPFQEIKNEKYDTILFLMNGMGVDGGIKNLPQMLQKIKALLKPGGKVIFDSSDMRFLYENEDGSYDINLNADYYGEFQFQMCYNEIEGDWFDWLYIDSDTMQVYAEQSGFEYEKVYEDDHYAYLATMTLKA